MMKAILALEDGDVVVGIDKSGDDDTVRTIDPGLARIFGPKLAGGPHFTDRGSFHDDCAVPDDCLRVLDQPIGIPEKEPVHLHSPVTASGGN